MKVVFFCLLCLLSISTSAQIFVDIDAVGLNNGSSWSDAFTSLHDALQIAETGNEIWVAEGRYVPNQFPRDSAGSPAMAERDFTFHLVNGVKLYGGFNATESLLSERNIDSNLTILSGEVDTVTLIFAYHVVLSVDDNDMTLMDGFTIRRGASFFPTPPPPITVEGILIERLNGCGLSNYDSDPTLKNITFFENITFLGRGGGIYNYASSPHISNVTFIRCMATEGGGMYNESGSNPSLNDVIFVEGQGYRGLGMYNDASSPTVISTTFERNVIETFPNDSNNLIEGAGMYNTNSSAPSLQNVSFLFNNSSNGNGGGMYNNNSGPTLINVLFDLNLAVNGGGMYNLNSDPILNYVSFSRNLVSDYGGGVYNLNSSPLMDNCSIGSNIADLGAGIYNDNSFPELHHGIISNNYANRMGGGMFNTNSSSPIIENLSIAGNKILLPRTNLFANNGGGLYNNNSSPTLTNVILLNNEASNGGGMHNNNSSPTLTDVEFANNKAFNKGGGMNNDSASSPVLSNVGFINNQTRHNEYSLNFDAEYQQRFNRGGGMHNDNGSSPSLTNVQFENNESNYGGGMSIAEGSAPILENVLFLDNEARIGGGLFTVDSSPSLTNIVFSNNRARGFTFKKYLNSSITFDLEYFRHKGGGMYNEGSDSIMLTNVIFSNNIAEADSLYRTNNVGPPLEIYLEGRGGGLYSRNPLGTASNITIINATFEHNHAEDIDANLRKGLDIYNDCPFAITLHNSVFISGIYNGTQIDGTLDLESAVGSNNLFENRYNPNPIGFVNISTPQGIDNRWGTADDGLRPVYGSSLINAGDNSFNSTPNDITGLDRIVEDTIEIGAYEFAVCGDTTEYSGGSWTNGDPSPSKTIIFKEDYNTGDLGNGSVLACSCIVETGNTLTIGEGTALHVYLNGINLSGTIVVEDGGTIINGITQ